MSEQEIREGMLLAVWDEPPLDFDPDTLIRRVEQKKSRRRALVTVGVATAMIVVASFSLPGLLPRDRNTQLGSETQTTSSPAPAESMERKAQLVGDRLVSSLGGRMTNLKDLYSSFNPGRVPVYPPYQTKAPDWSTRDSDFSGYLYLTDDIGPTALRVTVSKGGLNTKSFCEGAVECKDVRQQDGTVVSTAEYLQGSPEVQLAQVARRFESGLVVQIAAFAYNPSNGNGQRQTVPVRVGVLTELVTDPGIRWE
ncbi:hypothetical protein GCM10011609_50680 [Lentzea pudingi]|uniref:Uncharacterized protein n=1 Tax=Lentzea pudingi TaxID=1789439 RepID=A0ABQ2IBU2_9PSEU|nr:hypothetical protein [Lentzea pudingi]GGN05338.1 hypothetical protein GCM10011609_50680 [Lentzea pudingi]